MREGLREFDRVYEIWTSVRGQGTPGILEETHEYMPELENAMVKIGMSPFPTDAMEKPYCYRETCSKSCEWATSFISLELYYGHMWS